MICESRYSQTFLGFYLRTVLSRSYNGPASNADPRHRIASKSRPVVLEMKYTDGAQRNGQISPLCFHFMHFMQITLRNTIYRIPLSFIVIFYTPFWGIQGYNHFLPHPFQLISHNHPLTSHFALLNALKLYKLHVTSFSYEADSYSARHVTICFCETRRFINSVFTKVRH